LAVFYFGIWLLLILAFGRIAHSTEQFQIQIPLVGVLQIKC